MRAGREADVNQRALAAEFIGTFACVLAISGAALFAAPGGGAVAVALAAGFSLAAMAYALGPVSGGHFNPAVTAGLVAGGRFPAADAVGYVAAQVLGAMAAAGVLATVLAGAPAAGRGGRPPTFAAIAHGFGGGSYTVSAVLVVEATACALLVLVIIGATSRRAPVGFAPIAIGFALAALTVVAYPVSLAALNPARATATAVMAGGQALADLWLFWLAPIAGGMAGGVAGKWLQKE